MKQKAFLCRSPIGLFVFSQDGSLLHYALFPANPEKAVEEFNTKSIQLTGFEIAEGREGYRFLRKNLREYAVSLGFAASGEELTAFLSDFAGLVSRKRMKSLIGRDRLVIQASNALEDLVKVQNTLSERLREWYLLHYPELRQKDVADLIVKYGRRERFPGYRESTGVELTESDEQMLKEYATLALFIEKQRRNIEKYIEMTVKEIAPNISSLVEPLLAARFLALAGSLERLAKMPSSTIQLLGAEKALFRHLRRQGRSPKFGIIFLDPRVQNAPEEKRGKAARVLASKLMLAARIDFYSKRDESEKLRKELKEELERI